MFWLCLRVVLFSLVAVLACVWMLPCPIDPVEFSISEHGPPPLVGPLAVNKALKRGVKLFENELAGPEDFAVDENGSVYTGLKDGRIIRFNEAMTSFITVARTGSPPYDHCGRDEASEDVCGRPLGVAFHKLRPSLLYVLDSYSGLLQLDVTTGRLEELVSLSHPGVLPPMKLPNDLVVLSNGSVFFTDSSSRFGRNELLLELAEGRSNGRLLHYNPVEGELYVAAEGLHFPNGICLDGPKEEALLLVETSRARILRYHLEGSRAGSMEVFADNLPGLPDNISPATTGHSCPSVSPSSGNGNAASASSGANNNGEGGVAGAIIASGHTHRASASGACSGYWVGYAAARKSKFFDTISLYPLVRKVLTKLQLLKVVEKYFPKHGLVTRLDLEGHVVQSLHDEGGEVTGAVSTVLEWRPGGRAARGGHTLLLGSYHAPYLVRLELDSEWDSHPE